MRYLLGEIGTAEEQNVCDTLTKLSRHFNDIYYSILVIESANKGRNFKMNVYKTVELIELDDEGIWHFINVIYLKRVIF